MQVRLPDDDEVMQERLPQKVRQRSPKEGKEMHARLPQDDDEESLGQSARASLNFNEEGNAEEYLHQLEMPAQNLSGRKIDKKRKEKRGISLKYFFVTGLVVVAIMILYYAINEKIRIDQIFPMNYLFPKGKQIHEGAKHKPEVIYDKSNTEKRQEENQQTKKLQKQQEDFVVQKNTNYKSVSNHGNFAVPRFVWTYSQDIQSNSFYVRKCVENIKYFSKNSSFLLTILSSKNYMTFLEQETTDKIDKVIKMLKDRIERQPKSNLKDHFDTIRRRLIVFHVLNENGGIFIEKNVLLTQSFQWLKDIELNIYVNKGSANAKAKYFGFFDPDHGSRFQKHNKSDAAYEPEKYMVNFPTFEPYFLVAKAREAFLTETLYEFIELLTEPSSLQWKLKNFNPKMGSLQGKDIYYQILYICQHLVISRKQQQIDRLGNNKYDDTFAIDEYGFLTMNERYFPKKLDFYFKSYSQEKIYKNLAKYNLAEMEATTGPMRYIACMTVQKHINNRIQRAIQKEERYYINPQSFLGKLVINNNSQPYTLKEYEKGMVYPQAKTWDSLPKIIWLYWDKGLKNSSVANKLCIENIRRAGAHNKFDVKELNDSNLAEYLGKETNDKINDCIKNSKIKTFAQTKSDFVRLAVIAKYGGIYFDASYFSIKGLEWIVNITQAPTETIFNRYGELPRVLMFFHPHFGTAFDWTYDKQANTKRQIMSAYQSNFIAAGPGQQFVIDWFDEHVRFFQTPFDQTQQIMKEVGVFQDRWTSKDNVYLAVMDSVKIAIGKRNKEMQNQVRKDPNYNGPRSGAQYYGLWSVGGYREQQKFRAHTNFNNVYNYKSNNHNVFLWRYSDTYVQGLIGNISTLVKLYGWNIIQLNKFIEYSYDSNFSDLHPHSFVAKYLYKQELHKIVKHDNQLGLEFIRQ